MSDIYDLYGLRSELQFAADLVSSTLEAPLELYSSDYWGEYYSTPLLDDTIRVIWNANEDPDEIPYDRYTQYSVIVEVNDSPVADEIRDKLVAAGFAHLDRDVLDT